MESDFSDLPYGMPSRPAGWRSPAILQHDLKGDLLFEHLAQGKQELAQGRFSGRSKGMVYLAGQELKSKWHGRIWAFKDQNEEESKYASRLAGLWDYDRVGFGVRPLELKPDGSIGLGAAACERTWAFRFIDGKPTIVITGDGHKGSQIGMMFLEQGHDMSWYGKWEAHERGPVVLRRKGYEGWLPWWWLFRPNTWDVAMFDAVVTHDEYAIKTKNIQDGLVIDVGSHTGTFTYLAHREGASSIHAYEPDRSNFKILHENTSRLNGVILYQEALGDESKKGRVVLCNDPVNTGGHGVVEDRLGDTIFTSLDTMIGRILKGRSDQMVRLIKLDCEGAEGEALKSCTRLQDVQEIVGEWHGGDNLRKCREALEAAGFQFSFTRATDQLGHFGASRKPLTV